MSRSADVTVDCPLCGEPLACWIDPGEPMVMYYADGSGYPGSPAGLDDYEPSCECFVSGLVDELKYADRVNELAMDQWRDR